MKKKIWREENSEMLSTGLLSYRYNWYFLGRIWWFEFSIPIVISDISLQPICTGHSDILYVFLTIYVPIIAILDIWKTTLLYEGESVVYDGFKYVWPAKG